MNTIESAESLLREASALLRSGRRTEATETYRRLLAIQPTQPDAWYNLGYLLRSEGKYEEALSAYGQALAHGIGHPEQVHLNRAVIYSDCLRRDSEAERELRAALTLDARFIPALLNLGNLHEERGEREEAIDCYERILSEPADSRSRNRDIRLEALARMAHLRPPESASDPALNRLQQAASTASAEEDIRANLMFALGRAYDALGLHDQAFDAFARGNRHARRTGPAYDRVQSRQRTDTLIAAFTAAQLTHPAPVTGAGPAPLFICGMFRSGSTLIEQVLAAHPQVVAGGELTFLPRLVAGPLAPFPASMATPAPDREAALAREYRTHLAQLFPHASAATYISDKRPDNFLLIGLIKRLFPAARIIHTTRHPLDNGLSLFMQHLDRRVASYANDLGDIGHYYGQYRRLMAHWKSLYGESILDFDYDVFVTEPQPALQRLLGFLGLDWDDRCLQFHELRNTVKTASYWQVRRPLYGEASGRWRAYQAHLGPLRRGLQEAGVETP